MATTPKPSDPAGQTEYRDIGSLLPYARNARTHTDEQVRQLAASITEWGWTMPVLIDEAGMILAGHARVRAAESLALTQVPVVVAKGWSEPKKRAYILADNQLAQNAGWDTKLLALELTELSGFGVNMSLAGFSSEDLHGNIDLDSPYEFKVVDEKKMAKKCPRCGFEFDE